MNTAPKKPNIITLVTDELKEAALQWRQEQEEKWSNLL
jgi:hypothetical protein